MFSTEFVEILKISTYIWINIFFLVSSLLTVYIWVKLAKSSKKVNDTLDVVQGTAFSIYESFDKKGSQIAGNVGGFIAGLLNGKKRGKW
jgi:hypothetical protein